VEFGRASTYVESVDLLELKMLAIQFLTGIAFSGLAEVEFMYDQKDTRFELLKINPRIWGWIPLRSKQGSICPTWHTPTLSDRRSRWGHAQGRQVGSPCGRTARNRKSSRGVL